MAEGLSILALSRARRGWRVIAAYSAASAGVISFTKALSREVAQHKVFVNCVAPGPIDTDMIQDLGADVVRRMISDSPVGRLGEASEVAHVVACLCTEASRFNTGAVFDMSGDGRGTDAPADEGLRFAAWPLASIGGNGQFQSLANFPFVTLSRCTAATRKGAGRLASGWVSSSLNQRPLLRLRTRSTTATSAATPNSSAQFSWTRRVCHRLYLKTSSVTSVR